MRQTLESGYNSARWGCSPQHNPPVAPLAPQQLQHTGRTQLLQHTGACLPAALEAFVGQAAVESPNGGNEAASELTTAAS
jgi:hypothetical protein